MLLGSVDTSVVATVQTALLPVEVSVPLASPTLTPYLLCNLREKSVFPGSSGREVSGKALIGLFLSHVHS